MQSVSHTSPVFIRLEYCLLDWKTDAIVEPVVRIVECVGLCHWTKHSTVSTNKVCTEFITLTFIIKPLILIYILHWKGGLKYLKTQYRLLTCLFKRYLLHVTERTKTVCKISGYPIFKWKKKKQIYPLNSIFSNKYNFSWVLL